MAKPTSKDPATSDYRGAQYGLPQSGAGSVAGFWPRLAALVIDSVLSALVAAFFTRPEPPRLWSAAVLVLMYTFFLGFFAQTPGMKLMRVACVNVRDSKPIGVPRALIRALLLQLFVPALVMDSDLRGWHDRAAGSIVIRTR